MASVFLGLGSNIEPAAHLRLAIRELRDRFGELELSPVYRNAPVGFEGEDFLNMVVRLRTSLGPRQLVAELEDIHRLAGRRRDRESVGPRELDIDLLLYDRAVVDEPDLELPRRDVLEYDFVLRPLADLAPDYRHPLTERRLSEHWQEHAAGGQRLHREQMDFCG